MTKSRVQINRSSVTRQRPVDRDPGELYVNFADLQIGVVNPARVAADLVAVRFFSEDASYVEGEFVVENGVLYKATAPSDPGEFAPANWFAVSSDVVYWDEVQSKPATFPPTLPILQNDVIGLTDELAEKLEDAPSDGEQYARQDAAWVVVTGGGGGSTDWADITGKPATFPPTLPIAQSGVTNLETDLAGKVADTGDTMTGPLVVPPGSAPATSVNFGTAGTGLHGDASNVRIAASGVNRMTVGTSLTMAIGIRAVSGAVGTPGYTWASDTDAGFYLSAAGDMRLAMAGADVVKWLDDKSTTFSGKVTVPASTTASAGLNLPQGSTPTTGITDGDIWLAGSTFRWRASGATLEACNISTAQTIAGIKTFSSKPVFPSPYGLVYVGTTAPGSPAVNDLWLDIN